MMSVFVGRQTPNTRLRIWAKHAPAIEQHMRTAAEEARHDYYEYLYVHRDDGRRTIRLHAGNHPISRSNDGSFRMEGGAALVLSQDSTYGHVAALIYPYGTSQSGEKPIIWGIFDSPADIATAKWLDIVVHDFARCCRASNVVDESDYYSDRIRMRWLMFRSWVLCTCGQLPGYTTLISAKPSLTKQITTGIAIIVTGLTTLLNLPSILATLSGFTVPALLERWNHNSSPVNAVSSESHAPSTSVPLNAANSVQAIPPLVVPAIAAAPESIKMPVISGWYTFCPTTAGQSNPKLLEFLYDVRANAGKVAFFDVQIDIDCVLSESPDYRATFRRLQEVEQVLYLMHVPLITEGDSTAAREWIGGNRNHSVLRDMYSDNGSSIAIHNGNDSRNPLSRFQPHVEGSNDILYGPYSIKESWDDAAITFDLNAPFLDSVALQQANNIAEELRHARTPLTQPEPLLLENVRTQALH